MASRDRIINLGTEQPKLVDINFIYDTGSVRKVYFNDRFLSVSTALSSLQDDIPELVTLTDVNQESVYVNPISVNSITYTANSEVVLLFDNAKLVISDSDINDVIDALNTGARSNTIEVITSVDYTVASGVELVIADTQQVTITIPSDRTSNVTIVNTSSGNIIIDPVTNTIQDNDTALAPSEASFTLKLVSSTNNWILI